MEVTTEIRTNVGDKTLGQKLIEQFKADNPKINENPDTFATIIDFCDFVDGNKLNEHTLPIFLSVVYQKLEKIQKSEENI
jgi:hypothetical protein